MEEDHTAQLGVIKGVTKGAKYIFIQEDNTQEDIGDNEQGVQPHHVRNKNIRLTW